MTITIEEWLSLVDWDRAQLLNHWEWDTKSWQVHKFARPLRLNKVTLQQRWSIKDVHDFCLKVCAIYATVDGGHDPSGLSQYLWDRWFQPGGTPCRFGNAFARYIRAWDPDSPKTVSELLDSHRKICNQVRFRQITLSGDDDDRPLPQTLDQRAEDPYENHENYRLEASFPAAFIVMDEKCPLNADSSSSKDRWLFGETQVLLVSTGDHHDLKNGPIDFAPIADVSEIVDGNEHVRRISLDKAVDFLMGLYQENKRPRAVLYE